MKKTFLAAVLPALFFVSAAAQAQTPPDGYQLQQVLMMSRHNLRAPLATNGSVLQQSTPKSWPEWEEALLEENTVPMVIQMNGKLRDKLEVPKDISREELEKLALASAKVNIFLDGVTVRKVIVVPGRLVNIVAN